MFEIKFIFSRYFLIDKKLFIEKNLLLKIVSVKNYIFRKNYKNVSSWLFLKNWLIFQYIKKKTDINEKSPCVRKSSFLTQLHNNCRNKQKSSSSWKNVID